MRRKRQPEWIAGNWIEVRFERGDDVRSGPEQSRRGDGLLAYGHVTPTRDEGGCVLLRRGASGISDTFCRPPAPPAELSWYHSGSTSYGPSVRYHSPR